jgi:hypothetical protein
MRFNGSRTGSGLILARIRNRNNCNRPIVLKNDYLAHQSDQHGDAAPPLAR